MKFLWIIFILASCSSHLGRGPSATQSWGPKWKLTFEDHFNGSDGSSCFTKTPTCMGAWGWRRDCPEYSSGLAGLNKCHWDAYDFYNYMDYEAPLGQGVNAFSPQQVKVQNGSLELSAIQMQKNVFNCKNENGKSPTNETLYTKDCQYISGGIESAGRGTDNRYGFRQKYGRYEIRAKLEEAPGSWPALWLLPQGLQESGVNRHCGWPHSGEIDLMEYWADSSALQSTFHSGDCSSGTHISKTLEKKMTKNWVNDWHTWILEWDEKRMAFYIDKTLLGVIKAEELDKKYQLPLIFPDNPMYFILNLTIERKKINNFRPHKFLIDYVKAYRPCSPEDDQTSCIESDFEDVVDAYNSEKNETAFAKLTTFPNPVRKNSDFKVKAMMKQDCEDVRLSFVNILGQDLQFPVKSGEHGNRELYRGPMKKNVIKEWTLGAGSVAGGMYLFTAQYNKCGYDQKGKGNHVVKFLIQ